MRVTIDPLAERRLWAFIRAKDVEVGGMGYAALQDGETVHWRETFLIPQEVSSSEVDFESTHGDQAAIERALEDGALDDPNFVWVSWHSHHTMKPFWSGTDNKRIAAMNKVGVKRLLSFVGCHDGSYEMRVDTFDFKAHGIYFPQVTQGKLPLTHAAKEPDAFEREIAAELEANVKAKSYKTGGYGFMGPLGEHEPVIWPRRASGRLDDLLSDDQDYDKDVDAPRRAKVEDELVDEGYTHHEARRMIDSIGLDDCELLLDGGHISGTRLGT